MLVLEYTAKIKSICDSLGSINVNIGEDEMVQVCLGNLAHRFDLIRTTIVARETLIHSSTSNQCYWLKRTTSKPRPIHRKDKFSSRIQMVAGHEVEAVEEVDLIHFTKGSQTFDNKTEAIEEPSEEGRASMPNKVGKHGPLLAIIVGRSATAKRSAERKEDSWPPQADNSQTTPPTPNTMTMVGYS